MLFVEIEEYELDGDVRGLRRRDGGETAEGEGKGLKNIEVK